MLQFRIPTFTKTEHYTFINPASYGAAKVASVELQCASNFALCLCSITHIICRRLLPRASPRHDLCESICREGLTRRYPQYGAK